MSKEELKHCPVCGATARVRHDEVNIWIECKKCHATSRSYIKNPDTRELVIEEWNEGDILESEV